MALFPFSLVEVSADEVNGERKIDKAEQQKRFEAVRKNIEQLKKELNKAKSMREGLHVDLEKSEKNIRELKNKTIEIETQLDQKRKKLGSLKGERQELQKKKNEQSRLVKEYLNSAYRLGQHGQVRLLLNQQDPARIARMTRYYSAFTKKRSEKVASFVTTIDRLRSIEPEIESEAIGLQNNAEKLKNKQHALGAEQKNRKKLLVKLDSELTDKNKRLNALLLDRRGLEKLLDTVYTVVNEQELAVSKSEFARLKGKLRPPTQGKRLNRYGARRGNSNMRWQGLQYAAARGTEVMAVHHGQVVFSDYLRGHGLLLVIDHGAGYMSLYAHNENLFKDLGEWVDAGEVIATVGDSGGRSNTALYFELRYKGKPTNPSKWFG